MADFRRGTLWNVTLLRERYGRTFLASVAIHITLSFVFMMAPSLLPKPEPILLGTGPGGGSGGGAFTVRVTDDLGGGAGMIKPSPIPQPPALLPESLKEEIKPEVVPLLQTVEPQKAPPKAEDKRGQTTSKREISPPPANMIPTTTQPGTGKPGGARTGTGHGPGSSGVGVSVGPGSAAFGDSWYVRVVESRIGSNWIKPQVPERIEIVCSFIIANDGRIQDVRIDKSSGNDLLDLAAERAIRVTNPLPPLPPQLRGKPVQFVAQFIYPP
jgi:TonB family protein